MRDYKDLAVVASIFVGGMVLAVLFFWLTSSRVAEQRELRFRSAITALSGDASVGEPEEILESPVLRVYPLETEDRAYLAELSVMGYRDELRFLARLNAEGRVEGIYLLADREDPAYDWFLRDRELLRSALNRTDPPEAISGATVTVRALTEAIEAARGTLEDL